MAIDPSGWTGGILVNIAAAAILAAPVYAWKKWRTFVERRTATVRAYLLAGIGLLYSAAVVAIHELGSPYALLFFVVTTAGVFLFVWSELSAFWKIGLAGADRSIQEGVTVPEALKLCNNSLVFLGIGASKLVRTGEVLDSAISRCNRPDRPIRFLLCDPANPELQQIAKQFGQDPAAYQTKVQRSLEYLQRLRVDRAFNIEIRLYTSLPLFRLMFIDDDLCLASHYVYGEGDGNQMPQMHLVRRVGTEEKSSLYFPMHRYFEELWSTARPV